MWIAKPLNALSPTELQLWSEMEARLPLAQTQCWARATASLGAQVFAVFSPNEQVGGIVFSITPGHYECINGPHLYWDEPAYLKRQLAVFAQAVSQLGKFEKLILSPRWLESQIETRRKTFPIEISKIDYASTIEVELHEDEAFQIKNLSPRFRRSIRKAFRNGATPSIEIFDQNNFEAFAKKMAAFGKKRGFTVPPESWFQTLTDNKTDFHLITTCNEACSDISQILVCKNGDTGHYLFGYEERTSPKNSVSLAAAGHWTALRLCQSMGLKKYDLNGYVRDVNPDHPYRGVNEFKKQFQGKVITYASPEIIIEI